MLTKWYSDVAGVGVCLMVCLFLVGCGSSRTLGRVGGQVSLDGKPCGGMMVVFACPEQRAFITAEVGNDGRYAVQMAEGHGLPLGTYEVTIRAAPPKSWDRPPAMIPIPNRYRDPKTSGLSFTVVEGENQFDIPMTTNPGAVR
jgi:hypothetical protein